MGISGLLHHYQLEKQSVLPFCKLNFLILFYYLLNIFIYYFLQNMLKLAFKPQWKLYFCNFLLMLFRPVAKEAVGKRKDNSCHLRLNLHVLHESRWWPRGFTAIQKQQISLGEPYSEASQQPVSDQDHGMSGKKSFPLCSLYIFFSLPTK